jgi:hypothetical protein
LKGLGLTHRIFKVNIFKGGVCVKEELEEEIIGPREGKVFLEDEQVKVTSTTFKFNNAIYPMHGITSIDIYDEHGKFPYEALILGVGLCGIGVSYKQLWFLIFAGLLFFLITFIQASRREMYSWLVIKTASGEEIEITDNEYQDIDELYESLEEALEYERY